MSLALTTITGTAQTGFTSPTYTVVSDNPPAVNGRQWAVTTLGGTQAGVTTHTVSDPFTITFFKPVNFATIPSLASNGVLPAVKMNKYVLVVRKGTYLLANQARVTAMFRGEFRIPAGADSNDPADVRALASVVGGIFAAFGANLGDTLVSGVM